MSPGALKRGEDPQKTPLFFGNLVYDSGNQSEKAPLELILHFRQPSPPNFRCFVSYLVVMTRKLLHELQDDNKLLALVTSLLSSTTLWRVANKPLTTCQQAGNKQYEHILLASCWNSIIANAIQVCCRFVTTCAFLRV